MAETKDRAQDRRLDSHRSTKEITFYVMLKIFDLYEYLNTIREIRSISLFSSALLTDLILELTFNVTIV